MEINCDVTVPKAGHCVLAAAVLRVHVAPLGARAVHSQAVALQRLVLGSDKPIRAQYCQYLDQ